MKSQRELQKIHLNRLSAIVSRHSEILHAEIEPRVACLAQTLKELLQIDEETCQAERQERIRMQDA